MTFAILGPGGVGGLLAGLLSRAGHRVICLARETTAETLRTGGIRVRSGVFGDFTAPVLADTVLRERVDACVVAVKATALPSALERVPAEALGEGLLVPLLNGVEHPVLLRRYYAPELVVPGAIRVESTRVEPGVVEHGSPFVRLDLASAHTPSERLAALAEPLNQVGVTTRVRDDEDEVLWNKMAFLAPMALLSTRYAVLAGGVVGEHRDELRALLAEIAAVCEANGTSVDQTAGAALYDAFPAATRSSMQRDAEAGRPLELDAIGGALLRAAARHGVPVPVAERLVGELTRLAPGLGSAPG
ncbi:2-dehydropantoate 2-reductase [Streptomyces sp. AJS327]|uniref:ketopantoate reductase family protein n=1 Tax=Streptomyces sp. AJS327 TaxID=2545265 RepID=UPI0015DEC8C4|nr:2-dehydropantoate 2-reductase [Streptomyces sp. AJS327]MBA0053873.1 2-dehydropantoate 2-reductase [Streptomyces sp. AJS327]